MYVQFFSIYEPYVICIFLQNTELKMAEKEEESKLKAKYPQLQRPGPQFLQKRLQKGVSVQLFPLFFLYLYRFI